MEKLRYTRIGRVFKISSQFVYLEFDDGKGGEFDRTVIEGLVALNGNSYVRMDVFIQPGLLEWRFSKHDQTKPTQ